MAELLRGMGPAVILPDAGYEVALTVATVSGPTLSGSHLTIPKGTYGRMRWCDYERRVIATIKSWLFARIAATMGGVNLGTASDIPWTLHMAPSPQANGSRVTLHATGLNATFGGVAKAIASITLDNTSGWLTPLGLLEDGVSDTVSASGGVVTRAGDYQPRGFYAFERFEQDTRDVEEHPNLRSIRREDGSGLLLRLGNSKDRRVYELIRRPRVIAGPKFPIGTFGSFSSNRKTITLYSADETGIAGQRGLYAAADLLTAGLYVRVGNRMWASRAKSVNTTAGTIALWEPFPAAIASACTAGERVVCLSEVDALVIDAITSERFLLWEADDTTGEVIWGAWNAYLLDAAGVFRVDHPRPSSAPFWNCKLPLVQLEVPELDL